MKDRETICQFYICKGKCSKGREAEHWGICQHCNNYKAKRGAAPSRVDTRRRKRERAEARDDYFSY